MSYVPHTPTEREAMLKAIGAESLDDLFGHLPRELLAGPLDLPPGLGEMELAAEMKRLAARNRSCAELSCFLGAGAYDHFIPPACLELISRGELYTAYTPYQPEISQGILQAIYEYQTMIATLAGCQVANASLYDGATALVEGLQMAVRHSGREEAVLLDGALHPHYIQTVRTALNVQGIEVRVLPQTGASFQTDLQGLARLTTEAGAGLGAVALAYPNFFGAVGDLEAFCAQVHDAGALVVVAGNPFSFGFLKPPGQMGADIVCGEAQSLGVPLQFGGPYLGYLACSDALVRRIPGRLVGRTVDTCNRQAFTLTLQAREQHIRREKATSNICTNTALCAMLAHFYMSCVGPGGLRRAAELCLTGADLLRQRLRRLPAVKAVPAYPAFHEFVYETKEPAARVLETLLQKGILGGLDLGRFDPARAHQILVCVTEKRSAAELDAYVAALGG